MGEGLLFGKKRYFWKMWKQTYVHSNFMTTDDERNLPAPWVHKAGPAGVQDDVVPVLRGEPKG